MSFEPRDDLRHIAAEADYLLDRSASLTFDTFLAHRSDPAGRIATMATNFAPMIESCLCRELHTLHLELDAYPDERLIWQLPAGLPNSAGTLALHLAGNLRHYIGAVLGGSGYIRDRDREFSARDLPREALLAELTEAESAIRATLPRLTEADLAREFPEPIRDHFLETADFLLHLAAHLAYHLGQVSYHRRLVTGEVRGVGALPSAELFTARPATGARGA